ncbi:MAG: 2-amino-4-hydroxy-6-hydroxymethyldihydropteridine diphosphokinase [Treponema sp.]|nr:2-amino-4-hydroxy-6-hydroxymethyldihydropteridine diphosphokinase [Treponema sp.]
MLAVLGLGSNRACGTFDSPELLRRACTLLEGLFSDFKISSVYRTKPMYYENQPDFYNMAVCGNTELSPPELLSKIHQIEESLGRDRKSEIRNGPRSIDIDIELYGNEEIHFLDSSDPMKNLEIPHPKISERAFVLIPVLEILPESAEIKDREFFVKSLEKLGNQGVELWKSKL